MNKQIFIFTILLGFFLNIVYCETKCERYYNIQLNPFPSDTTHHTGTINGKACVHSLLIYPPIDIYSFETDAHINVEKNWIGQYVPLETIKIQVENNDHTDKNVDAVEKTYKWNQVLQSPSVLAGNHYHNLFYDYYQSDEDNVIRINTNLDLIKVIFKSKRLDFLQYIIEKLNFNYKRLLQISYSDFGVSDTTCDLLYIATRYGALEIIKYLESLVEINKIKNSNRFKFSWNYTKALSIAPYSDDIEILKYIGSKAIDNISDNGFVEALANAIRRNHMDMIEWISNHSNVPISFLHLSAAIESGNMFDYCWARVSDKGEFVNCPFIEMAIRNKNYDLAKWFYHNSIGTYSESIMDIVAGDGDLPMLQWLHETIKSLKCTKLAMDTAASNGHLNVIKWLHENRTEGCTKTATDIAAMNGHLEIIKWLHENRTEGFSKYGIGYAAMSGHLNVIEWIHHNRTEGSTSKAMDYAAKKGYVEIIKWLHENRTEGCTTNTMDYAARNGDLKLIQWLHENSTEGCTKFAMDDAAANGNFEIVKWLHENRTEGCTKSALIDATKNGHLEVSKWLHKNRTEGCTAIAMNLAISRGYFKCVKWLHENRTEGCTYHAMDWAAENGHFKIVKWLHENRTEGCSSKAIERSAMLQDYEITEWLYQNRTELCIKNLFQTNYFKGLGIECCICEECKDISIESEDYSLF